ncbi:MAG: Biopolymer transport protein ExbD [bacterium ADurb.Bin429]|nr:MAG: Biopolymer transport protein ExbD [bacterium ADurb.Bin429]
MSLSRGRRHELHPKVEINIIPLVDVMLVLLIIVMLTASFEKTAGLNVKLPTSAVTQSQGAVAHDIVIGIDRRGGYFWNGRPVPDASLNALLANERAQYGTEGRVIVQADARASHGRVVGVMTLAQQAGFGKLVVATRQTPRRTHGQ